MKLTRLRMFAFMVTVAPCATGFIGCEDKHGRGDAGDAGEDRIDGDGEGEGDQDAADPQDGDPDAPDAADELDTEITPPDIPGTIYVVPAIKDETILPDSTISESLRSYEISVTACPGEYEPASFAIHADEAIPSLELAPTELESADGSVIPADSVDIFAVKCWWQAGLEIWDNEPATKRMTPELLLKDDSLVRVTGESNELKLAGEYVVISEWNLTNEAVIAPTPGEFPVQDSAELMPVDIPAGTNKQFWVTVHVPPGAAPGEYAGRIQVTYPAGSGELLLLLRVLPFELDDSFLTYSLYYGTHLSADQPEGTISSFVRSEEQLRSELINMVEHGVTNPTSYQWPQGELFARTMTIRGEAGMDSTAFYSLGMSTGNSSDPAELEDLKTNVRAAISAAAPFGITDLYIYGIDEAEADALAAQRPAWEAVHEAGGKVFVAGYTAERAPPGNFAIMGDLQDLLVCAGEPSAEEAGQWHSEPARPHLIFNYANPQVGSELPETYRRNYGILLWQKDYDGSMDFAYSWSMGHIWNDFDHKDYRDHNFTYPTVDGVIDTIQWEGFREGVDDTRYLATLIRLKDERKAEGFDTSAIEQWIGELERSDLADPYAIRSRMIDHILCLLGEGECAPVETPDYTLLRAGTPPVIDGDLSEFSGVPSITLNPPAGGNTAIVRALWDAEALYVSFEASDSQLNGTATVRDAAAVWSDDAVEFFIDVAGDDGGSADTVAPYMLADDYQFVVNLLGTVSDASGSGTGAVVTSWNGDWDSSVAVDGTIGQNTDTDTGFAVEARIPWSTLGLSGPPAVAVPLGMSFTHEDLDASGAFSCLMWPDIVPPSAYQNAANWRRVALSDTVATP
jgi:hypothetical protein